MDIPILCLDTCIILDMLRDPTRPDLRVHDHKASLALLNAAEAGPGIETLVAQQVGREFRDNADRVEDEARNRIAKRRADVDSLNRLVSLYGAPGRVDLAHWSGHEARCRRLADRWLKVSAEVPDSKDIVSRAFLRLNEARTPAGKGKDAMKDCVVLETYIDAVRTLRNAGRESPAVFVSSNIRDFAATDQTTIREDVRIEFEAIDLQYAPNMGAARGFLGL